MPAAICGRLPQLALADREADWGRMVFSGYRRRSTALGAWPNGWLNTSSFGAGFGATLL